jgi:hypothetical protein
MLVIARITDKKLYSRYTWEYLRDATPEDEEAWDFRNGSSITVDIPTKVMKKNAPKAYQYSLKGILGHELIAVDLEDFMRNLRKR